VAGGHAAGGSAGLAELIDKYGEHVYRDLHEYAGGLNLVAALRDGSGYSPRQILLLIKGLPLESATIAAMRGGVEFRGWGLDRYLSAALHDAVKENTFAFVAANSKKKPTAPEPMFRPKEKKAKTTNGHNNLFAQRLAAARKAKAARRAQGE
jgi:hypothetical protein